MNCSHCKAAVEPDSRFCKHCGGAIDAEAHAPHLDPAAAPPAPDVYRDPAQEQEIWRGHPAWQADFGSIIVWAVLSVALVFCVMKWTTSGHFLRTAQWWLVMAGAAVVFFRIVSNVWRIQYRLTTQRLFVHRGLFTRVTDQLELVQVDDVRIRQGVIDQMVNTGDIELVSSDSLEPDLTLHAIRTPAEISESIRTAVRSIRGKGTVFVKNV